MHITRRHFPAARDSSMVNALILSIPKSLEMRRSANREEDLNNVYYLLGDCYAKQEDYANACASYEKALQIAPDNGSYYRDYAIALACSGNIEEAKNILSSAKEKGLDSVEADYVQGEILFNMEDYLEARQIFEACIDKTEDSYVKMRAYIMTARCIDKMESGTTGTQEKIRLLEEAEQELSGDGNIGVLEELAQAYCDAGAEGDDTYYQKAIEIFKQIEKQGMSDYDTEYNLAVLYQNVGDYSNAAETLDNILKTYGRITVHIRALLIWKLPNRIHWRLTSEITANLENIIRKQMSYIRKSLLPMQMMRIWSDSRNFTNRQ